MFGSGSKEEELPVKVKEWVEEFVFDPNFDPDNADCNIAFVIAGYAIHSLSRSMKARMDCKYCMGLLVQSLDAPE